MEDELIDTEFPEVFANISFNKGRLIKGLAIVIFLSVSLFLIPLFFSFSSWNNGFKSLLGLGQVLLFAFIFNLVYRILSTKPAIQISEKTFIDHVSKARLGKIPLKNIDAYAIRVIEKKETLVIYIHDFNEKSLTELGSRKFIARTILHEHGTPLIIPLNRIVWNDKAKEILSGKIDIHTYYEEV